MEGGSSGQTPPPLGEEIPSLPRRDSSQLPHTVLPPPTLPIRLPIPRCVLSRLPAGPIRRLSVSPSVDGSPHQALLGLRNPPPVQTKSGRAGTKRAAGRTKTRGQAAAKVSALSHVVACDEGMDTGNEIKRSTVPCNCRKSRCLKLYCECFAADRYCNGCHCQSCMNTPVGVVSSSYVGTLLLPTRSESIDPLEKPECVPVPTGLGWDGCGC